jgi:leucyl-tRNA synthetase
MDTFVESSWYFLRYLSPKDDHQPFDKAAAKHWMPVDQYIGGNEHAVMHLLYARFYTKVLRDLGYLDLPSGEPFTRLLTQGMVCAVTYKCPEHKYLYPEQVIFEDPAAPRCSVCQQTVTVGRLEKMSKSQNNVVDPDQIIARYGADTARVFTLFAAPPDRDFDWSEEGVEGSYRFLGRVWRLIDADAATVEEDARPEASQALRRKVHKTIKKVTDDVTDRFQFNTAIAAIMELVNATYEYVAGGPVHRATLQEAQRTVVLLASPFAPHAAEELWSLLGGTGLVADHAWPSFDAEAAKDDRITVVVQVNGKLRGRVEVEPGAAEEVVRAAALAEPNVVAHLQGKPPRKVIVVPGRLVNVVV